MVAFKKLDRTSGIDEDVYVPVWQLAVGMKNGGVAIASKTPSAVSEDAGAVWRGYDLYGRRYGRRGADNMKMLSYAGIVLQWREIMSRPALRGFRVLVSTASEISFL